MSRNPFSRVLRYGALVALLGVVGVQPAAARPKPGVTGPRQGFDLFASVFGLINANNWYCGISNRGNDCVDPNGSPVLGGGFWPKGTPDQYIFNAGLQIAGVIPGDAGFSWANDTVGAYFMDPRGDQAQGDGVSLVYSSIDPSDAANWPDQAIVRDTAVYNAVLIGRNTISQQDTWVRYWDGNPTLLSGRKHPMGILVDQRSLAWSDPAKQDIVFFIYTFYNITATDASAYAGIDPALRDSIMAVADRFHAGVKDKLGVTIPSAGYAFDSLYAAFFSDEDVGDAGHNYSTAILPFNLMMAYKSDFLEPNWTFPPSIFSGKFAASPGFVGFKYLRSPVNPVTGKQVGLTLFSNTLNSSVGFPDPVGVVQLWRYLSGHINPGAGDNPCTSPTPIKSHICYQAETAVDTRSYQASGPFVLQPGQSATIVVALIGAAPVAKPLADLGANGVGGDVAPGFPPTGEQIASGAEQPRVIDSISGWLSQSDANNDGTIEQNEVQVVPGSLLGKALLAQAVFDNKFLLPFAPESPQFYLVPGSGQVTVIWSPSASEATGDPYYTVASDPTSPLYDPNYRQHDVEGYRVYRGRTTGDLQLIAQFDYANTTFTDYLGAFDYGNQCAPELGVTGGCPAESNGGDFANNPVTHDIKSPFVQVLPGSGRALLADGSVFILHADTAVTNQGFPPLTDTGVPFAYVDKGVRNSFTYYYSVTAFDVNSPKAGSSSYESARITKSVTPRTTAANQVAAGALSISLNSSDGTVLDPTAAGPTIDATTGEFSGPAVPSDAFKGTGAQLFAAQLVMPNASAVFQIDSVVPAWYHYATYYLTVESAVDTEHVSYSANSGLGPDDGDVTFGPIGASIPANNKLADSLGLERLPFAAKAQAQLTLHTVQWQSADADWHPIVDNIFWGPASGITDVGGSRWFDGDNEAMADPTLGLLHGQLTGVADIFEPSPYTNTDALVRRFYQSNYDAFRSADIKVYWGSTAGTVDSVIDETYHVPVPFSTEPRASYGFVGDLNSTGNGGPDGLLSYADFLWGPCLSGNAADGDPSGVDLTGCASRHFSASATLLPVDTNADGTADGQGFGMYINSEPYIFVTTALPAAPTVWTYRSYNGAVAQSGGSYTFTPKPANVPVPGLQVRATTSTAATYPTDSTMDLSKVHTVPDPYYATNALEATATTKVLEFVNLPNQAIIRIYSVSGVLVQVLYHNDPTGGGQQTWNLRNRNNQFVASGVYFFHVEAPNGQEKVGRFTVINYAQ